MLYLCNSGFRPGHTTNVLNTLYLPAGCINIYRYKIGRNVGESITESLKPGDETTILFIDRYAISGYRFHPLRSGTFVRVSRDADRLLFEIRLNDFVYPRNMDEFQNLIKSNLPPGLASPVGGNREEKNDGLYAIVGKDVVNADREMVYGEDAWTKCTDEISQTRAFASDG